MTNQSNYSPSQRVMDRDGNDFIIKSIVDHPDPLIDATATLKGAGGEKEIGTLDLRSYTLVK